MLRRERIPLIVETLQRLARAEADYVVFEDKGLPENYVQMGDFGPGKATYVEVTCRDWGGGSLPPLSDEQVDALAALGFGRKRSPNYGGVFDWPDPVCIAKVCESAFMILGCPLDFDLVVKRFAFWSRPQSNIASRRKQGEVERVVHPDPCREQPPEAGG